MLKRTLFLALLIASSPVTALAQGPRAGSPDTLGAGDFTLERTVGFSWFSPGGSLGDVTNRRLYVVGLRGNSLHRRAGPFTVATTFDLVPLTVIERTAPNGISCRPRPEGEVCVRDSSARVVVGAGGSPLGAKVYFPRPGAVSAHLAAATGVAFFSSDVPINNSSRFNFTFEYGGGLEVRTRGGRAIVLGYKFHHISNGGMGLFNPGLDANVFYFGLVRRQPRSGSP
jgi:hypothetical protein